MAKEKKLALKYKEMYEVERKNHEEMRSFYEAKLQHWQEDHHLLIGKYEQRASILTNEIQQLKAVSIVDKSRKSLCHESPYSSLGSADRRSFFQSTSTHKYTRHRIEEEPDEELFDALSTRCISQCARSIGLSKKWASVWRKCADCRRW